jgi:hypothetical protein
MKISRSFIYLAVLLILALSPFHTHAQSLPDIPLPGVQLIPGATKLIDLNKATINKIPTVPTNDLNANAKSSGIVIPFINLNIGVSWNQLALNISKIVVNQLVDKTVVWMQSGFEGSPAYVADPKSYFGNLANGVLGDELNKLSKGVLCTPFQAKITLAIRKASVGGDYSPQCTLSGIVKNYDNFINSFQEGGWESWFAITQNSSNNPFGALADAQLTVNGKVDAEVSSASQEVAWGSGFKSQQLCKKKNISKEEALAWLNAHPDDTSTPPGFVPGKDFGACIEYGDVMTPGATIKSHLDAVLPANAFLGQVLSAESFDKLLTALGNGLLQRFVFKGGGLLGKAPAGSSGGGSGPTPTEPTNPITCSASIERATAKEDIVTWSYSSSFPQQTQVDVVWGDTYTKDQGSINGQTGSSATTTYLVKGEKHAFVTASTTQLDDVGEYMPSTHKEGRVVDCSNTVKVSENHPLQVQCTVDTSRITIPPNADKSDGVTYTATIRGGSGSYTLIKWDGDQKTPPNASGLANTIFPYELTQAQSNLPAINWCYGDTGGIVLPHTGSQCDAYYKLAGLKGANMRTGVTVQKLTQDTTVSSPTFPVFNSTLSRIYFKDSKSNLGSVKATITVFDADPLLEQAVHECPSVPVLDY